MSSKYAVRLVDAAQQPITDAGTVLVTEALTLATIATTSLDASGFTGALPLLPGVLYRLATESAHLPAALLMPGRDGIITISPGSTNAGSLGFAPPYALVVPYTLLGVDVTASGAWTGTVSGGGLTGGWLTNNGANWIADGILDVPLDFTKLQGASYWRADATALATISTSNAAVVPALELYAPNTVQSSAILAQAATATSASARSTFVLDASATDVQVSFRFTAPSDPGLTVTAITGEVAITPYVLQPGQST